MTPRAITFSEVVHVSKREPTFDLQLSTRRRRHWTAVGKEVEGQRLPYGSLSTVVRHRARRARVTFNF